MDKSTLATVALAASCAAPCALAAGTGDRTVFAHYMTCYSRSVDVYKREILLAQRYGIDGWALNCGNWLRKDEKGEWVPNEGYVASATRIFQAAEELGTGFQLFFSPDGGLEGYRDGFHSDMLLRFKDHPNHFRYDGKPFFSGWAGWFDKYAFMRDELRAHGVPDVVIVPSTGMSRNAMFASPDLLQHQLFGHPDFTCDGLFYFGCDGSTREISETLSAMRYVAMKNRKIFMAGPCPAYNSANLRDFHGTGGYAAEWARIVADQPELVEIVTWNDYNEDSGLMPSSADYHPAQIAARTGFSRDESFLDLTSYFSAAYKAGGRYPEIAQDKVYTATRTRPKTMGRVFRPDDSGDRAGWVDSADTYLQAHDDVQDNVYASALLTESAELSIVQSANGETRRISKAFPKGYALLEAPMLPGATPEITLTRNGETLVDIVARRQIAAEATERNSHVLTYDGAHRVWTGGAVAGEPLAVLVNEGAPEWDMPAAIDGVSCGVRVRYVNSTPEEARRVMRLDVPWMDEKAEAFFPVQFPLYLPPTGGEEKELGFLFTVTKGATRLRILKEDVSGMKVWKNGGETAAAFDYSDYGEAEIRSVAFVENKPFAAPEPFGTTPEMVEIPGGRFTMGEHAVEPDEFPARDVEVAPFAIGKYEVTNLEFEQFMPSHRDYRSLLSWRDRDPVIYVSWREAAHYCNWLSEKEGLVPQYDPENGYERVEGANGYRLPTEEEWEYVATGRGEGRIYPWGDEEPTQELCNFTPKGESLRQDRPLAPRMEERATPVGSYPLGASRDGVMDMAGNVCEWCDNWYKPDVTSGRQAFRAIRGGSFGYYGGSQRNCDREFNTAVYEGYIYIGFRVVRPQ